MRKSRKPIDWGRVIAVIVGIFLALSLVGCGREMVVYNGCTGSWVKVVDGRGNLLVSRLNYGNEETVDVGGYQGSTVEFLAAGYELGTN